MKNSNQITNMYDESRGVGFHCQERIFEDFKVPSNISIEICVSRWSRNWCLTVSRRTTVGCNYASPWWTEAIG